uniref:Uncharacterized protein n=1 Tax=Romanomermis culicivorax TaxID=13658 RepID=A0A915HT86_ROMCU
MRTTSKNSTEFEQYRLHASGSPLEFANFSSERLRLRERQQRSRKKYKNPKIDVNRPNDTITTIKPLQQVGAEADSDSSQNPSLRKSDEENEDIDKVVICENNDF